MRAQPLVVLLSGTSCSGKTAVAVELQRLLSSPDNPVLHVEADQLIPHPPKAWPPNDTQRLKAFSRALRRSIAVYAEEGFDLIVDGVLPYRDPDGVHHALSLYGQYRLLYVGVHCNLAELEKREKDRTDRQQGWAREQLQDLHDAQKYDFELDTSDSTASYCAKLVLDFLSKEEWI